MTDNKYRDSSSRNQHGFSSQDPFPPKKNIFTLERILIIGFLLFVVGYFGYNYYKNHEKEIDEKIGTILGEDKEKTSSELTISKEEKGEDISYTTPQTSSATPNPSSPKEEYTATRKDVHDPLPTSEILERRAHDVVVEQARQAGVSTKGSTSEILDRITHANVVEQARQAGVSTEGSTSEILDRITHANVVEQARQAGVSTKGATSEILDRITHANVVEQARQAGVSTKGSTSEILDRIISKELENLDF